MNANSNQTASAAKAAPIHKFNPEKVLIIARKHLGQNQSARVCMADAITQYNEGNIKPAMVFALRSIAHSVGILHADYTTAFNASGISGGVRLVSGGAQ